MTFVEKLNARISKVNSRVCVGLDIDPTKLPTHLSDSFEDLFEFNKQIIDATHEYVCAYKPNIAFYEVLGTKGWELLEKTIEYIPNDIITIADAKRGDIGNTAAMYAKTFFETYQFDSITVNPYMGYDSVSPYLSYEEKGTIILGLTSNSGSEDFEKLSYNGKMLAESVAEKVVEWNENKNCLLVVGATNKELIQKMRNASDDIFFLVPGIGAQGGSIDDVIEYAGENVIINSSRGIIYASQKKDFAETARHQTEKLQNAINTSISRIRNK